MDISWRIYKIVKLYDNMQTLRLQMNFQSKHMQRKNRTAVEQDGMNTDWIAKKRQRWEDKNIWLLHARSFRVIRK